MIKHFPEDDSNLPDNQIVISDITDDTVINLPGLLDLKHLNRMRKASGLPPVKHRDLRELQWMANIMLNNQYTNASGDKYTLFSFREISIQEREPITLFTNQLYPRRVMV